MPSRISVNIIILRIINYVWPIIWVHFRGFSKYTYLGTKSLFASKLVQQDFIGKPYHTCNFHWLKEGAKENTDCISFKFLLGIWTRESIFQIKSWYLQPKNLSCGKKKIVYLNFGPTDWSSSMMKKNRKPLNSYKNFNRIN